MRRSTIPFAALLLLGALQLAPAQDAPDALPADAPAEPPAALVNPNPLSGLNLDSLSATRDLPLFTPSRTAPMAEAPVEPEIVPVEEPVVEPEQGPPPVQLVGIVLSEDSEIALLLDTMNNEVHRLSSGEEYEGWALKIVDARSVELRSGDRVEGLKMFESFDTPSPVDMIPTDIPMDALPPDFEQLPDPNAVPTEADLQAAPEGMPLPDPTGSLDAGIPPIEEQLPPVEFDPALGEAPIPDEGALAPDGGLNAQ
jgi:general secretion pathway protein N